ncbi:MAG: MarR family transcriptional regulator [Pseudomonadota bacterium]
MHMVVEARTAAFVTMVQDRLELSSDDLSPRAASVLTTLLQRGPVSVSWLSEIVGVSQPTATRLIEGLEKRELVARSPKVRRTVQVRLTRKGRARAQKFDQSRQQVMADFLAPLTAEQRTQFGELLDCVLYAGTQNRRHARTTCRYCNHGVCCEADCPIDRRAGEVEARERNAVTEA